MSDTTPTPRTDEEAPSAEQGARPAGEGEQPGVASAVPVGAADGTDPADRTDTAVAPTLPPGYAPVAASEHLAPEPAIPAPQPQSHPETETPTATPAEPAVEQPAQPPASTDDADAAPIVAPAQTTAPAPALAPAPAPGPIYVPAPLPPVMKSNRGLGILIAVLGVVVFAVLDAAGTYGILLARYGEARAQDYLLDYLKGWEFWIPLAVFAAAFIALAAIVNRGRWWGYVLGSVVVSVLVFAGYFGAALITQRIWERTPGEFREFLNTYFQGAIPYVWVAVLVSFLALEVVIWLGAWVAFHGQNAARRNAEAKAAFEAEYGRGAVR